jgi:hypothetical protein
MNPSSIETVLPKQWNEPSISQWRAAQLPLQALDQRQRLRTAIAQRDE